MRELEAKLDVAENGDEANGDEREGEEKEDDTSEGDIFPRVIGLISFGGPVIVLESIDRN